MKRRLLFLIMFAVVLSGCGRGEKPREGLARLNVEYSESSFIENAREGNSEAVKLFLGAGMNTEVKTKDGQTALMVAALGNEAGVVKLLLERGGGLHPKAQKDFKKARRNAKQAGQETTVSMRVSEANQALGFLTSAKADIIDP